MTREKERESKNDREKGKRVVEGRKGELEGIKYVRFYWLVVCMLESICVNIRV